MKASLAVRGRAIRGPGWCRFIMWMQWVTLSVWLGSMVFLSAIVAPTAFAVLPDSQVAADLVGQLLDRLYVLAYLLGPVLLLVIVLEGVTGQVSLGRVVVMGGLVVLLVSLNVYSREVVSKRIQTLRRTVGIMGATPATDARRAAFDQLHHRSVQLMGASILLALTLTYLGLAATDEPREVNKWRA